jgi:hypothetical protein
MDKAVDLLVKNAKDRADTIARSGEFSDCVETVRRKFPRMVQAPREILDRDYLRIVDQHLQSLIAQVSRHIGADTRNVLDSLESGRSYMGRCELLVVSEEETLPFDDAGFEFSQCSSVLDYCSFWEVRKLARPVQVRLSRTPLPQPFRPWTTSCLERL